MKAFVTGSTGLLGSNLVHLLSEQGHEVKALARARDKARQILADTRAEIVVGDMENIEGFAAELEGSDVLFHTAAYFREYLSSGNHWPMLEKINIQGTIKLLTEAEKRGVKKVIYVSSSSVIGGGPNGEPGDESSEPGSDIEENLYAKSKVLAEQAIGQWLKTHALPVVLILPTVIYGPSDAGPTGAGKVILDFLHQRLPGIPPGGFSVIDARDVAQAMINAVEQGRSGERYIINNRLYSIGEILQMLENITGVPAPTRRIPYPVALAVAWLSETRARLTGGDTAVTVNGIRVLRVGRQVKADKAKRELGLTVRPFEDTLRDEVNWYVEHGYVEQPAVRAVARA